MENQLNFSLKGVSIKKIQQSLKKFLFITFLIKSQNLKKQINYLKKHRRNQTNAKGKTRR